MKKNILLGVFLKLLFFNGVAFAAAEPPSATEQEGEQTVVSTWITQGVDNFIQQYLPAELQNSLGAILGRSAVKGTGAAAARVASAATATLRWCASWAPAPVKRVVQAVYDRCPEYNVIEKAIYTQLRETAFYQSGQRNEIALVRQGSDLPRGEINYLTERDLITKAALERFLDTSLDGQYLPRIAFCGSGGGYRAMTCSLGSLIGAQEIGLLDCVTYYASLSGSTWMLPWFYSNENLETYREGLSKRMTNLYAAGQLRSPYALLPNSTNDLFDVLRVIASKGAAGQPRSIVDFYGALVANRLFDGTITHRLSELTGNTNKPMFIGVAVTGNYMENNVVKKEWFEFTPFEVGSAWLNMYVPTWAFGQQFAAGSSIDRSPEQPVSTLMGTFGSAFGLDVADIYREVQGALSGYVGIAGVLAPAVESANVEIGGERVSAGVFHNFTAGLQSPIADKDTIKLIDAGLAFNLPTPPLLRPERAVDIIIILDASGGAIPGELVKTEQYAREKNLSFPQIDYTDVDKRAVSIFRDEDPNVPVVMYMPRIVGQEYEYPEDVSFDVEDIIANNYANTFNFVYTPENVAQLSGLTQFNMVSSRDTIAAVIREVVAQKSAGLETEPSEEEAVMGRVRGWLLGSNSFSAVTQWFTRVATYFKGGSHQEKEELTQKVA